MLQRSLRDTVSLLPSLSQNWLWTMPKMLTNEKVTRVLYNFESCYDLFSSSW